MYKIISLFSFSLFLVTATSVFGAVITNLNGTTIDNIYGTQSPDQITNEGRVRFDILGNNNSGDNSTGGHNTITNTETGIISLSGIIGTYNSGFQSSGGTNIITNNGEVTGDITGTYNSGFQSSGGTNIITNNGEVTGDITGTYNSGFQSSGGSNIITNNGRVNDNIFGSYNYAQDRSGGSNLITNYGTVDYSIIGSANMGSFSSGGSNLIINYGTVNRNINGSANGNYSRGGSNVIINFGTVDWNIYGSFNYMGSNGNGNTIYNSGIVNRSIYGSLNWESYLFPTSTIGGSNTINNSGTVAGDILGSKNSATYSSGGSNTINNFGTITGSIFGSHNYGSDSSSSGNNIINSGSVGGDIWGSWNSGVNSIGGNDTIINSGTVIGSIYGEDGNDTIIHVGGQTVNGTSDGGDDIDTLGFNNFGDIIDTLHTKYINFENLGIYGGINELIGDWVFSDTATIDSGTLYINESIVANAFIINSAGILGGNGTITSDVTNHGVISPGNSIGTINVIGNLTFDPGSVYIVELSKNGNTDLIKVTGKVTISGGTLHASLPRALYANGDSWTVIKAGGGIEGNFSHVTQPNSATLSLSTVNKGNILILVVKRTPYQSFAKSASSIGVAAALNEILPYAQNNDRMASFLTSLDFDYTAAGIAEVLEMLTPYIYNNMSDLEKQTNVLYDNSLSRRTSLAHLSKVLSQQKSKDNEQGKVEQDISNGLIGTSASKKGVDVWVRAITSNADRAITNNMPGYSSTTNGVVVGIDGKPIPELLLGVSFGGSTSHLDGDGTSGNGDTKGFHTGIYGLVEFDNIYLDGSFTYSNYGVDTERPVIANYGQAITNSDYQSNAFSTRITAGYDYFASKWIVTPLVSLAAHSVKEGSFQEEDNGQLVINGDGRTNTYIDSSFGVRIANYYQLNRMSLLPKIETNWVHGFNSSVRVLDASFEGYESVNMEIEGTESGEDFAQLIAGLQMFVNSNISLYLDYNLLTNSDYTSQLLALGLDWKF